ncbi:CREB/ATF bZIP transcription factor [Geodia barretti]|uniref:X-box-binding protein 1 n=1 Tax=Geodia barretti TaxID=519541 RepID=A0AA35TX87_GEOBA|nr:CREB/ATF bZIP transcription factor [Geodia barretti]
MALSPTGIYSSLADWDCSRALDALLAEEDGGVSVVPLLQVTGTCEISTSASSCGDSPLDSPTSDEGSTQSIDSGFSTAPGLVKPEEDQLLAGLFIGENISDFDFLACGQPTSSGSFSLSPLAAATVPAPLTVGTLDNDSSPLSLDSVPQIRPTNRRNSMFSSDFDLDSPSPPANSASRAISKNNGPLVSMDKSRKNAEAARQNRLKKKKYMEELEQDRSRLRADNVVLKTRCTELQNRNRKLETEVAYLRSVLANQSTLSTLIKNIPGIPGVNLTSSFSRKRPGESAVDSASTSSSSSTLLPPTKRSRGGSNAIGSHSGGICLHVSKESVSLEFCAQCSLKSGQV